VKVVVTLTVTVVVNSNTHNNSNINSHSHGGDEVGREEAVTGLSSMRLLSAALLAAYATVSLYSMATK
jgi:hypothetical protein